MSHELKTSCSLVSFEDADNSNGTHPAGAAQGPGPDGGLLCLAGGHRTLVRLCAITDVCERDGAVGLKQPVAKPRDCK